MIRLPFPKDKILGFLISLVSLFFLPLAVWGIYRAVSPFIKAAPEATPEKVFVSNLNDHGLTISWLSGAETTGFIRWRENEGSNFTAVKDDRGGDLNFRSFTHHVSLRLTTPPSSHRISLRLVSGSKEYCGEYREDDFYAISLVNVRECPSGGVIYADLPSLPAYDPTRAPSPTNTPGAHSTEAGAFSNCSDGKGGQTPCYRPYPLWGKVTYQDGSAAAGALVYLRVFSPSNRGISTLLSFVTDTQGRFLGDLANALTFPDRNRYIAYATDVSAGGADTIRLKAVALDTAGRFTGRLSGLALHSVVDTNPATMDKPSPLIIQVSPGGPENTPPTAAFTVSPATGTTNTVFSFDASASSDRETSPAALLVRWNWENDATWDTEYSASKSATHRYQNSGTKTIKLEVKDEAQATASAQRQVVVSGGVPEDHHKLIVEFGLQGRRPSQWNSVRKAKVTIKGPTLAQIYVKDDLECTFPSGSVCQIIIDLDQTGVDRTYSYKVLAKPDGYLQKKIAENVRFTNIETKVGGGSVVAKAGDFNGDNKLNILDISKFLSIYKEISVPVGDQNRVYDLNDDGKISILDLSIVLSNYTQLVILGDE